MRRYALLTVAVLLVGSLASCAPAGSSDGTGDGLHSIVPSLAGLSLVEAEAVLDQAGYTLGAVTGEADSADGVVIEQEPIASTSLPRGAEVDLVLGTP